MVLFALLTGRNKTELSLLEPLGVIGSLRGFVTGSQRLSRGCYRGFRRRALSQATVHASPTPCRRGIASMESGFPNQRPSRGTRGRTSRATIAGCPQYTAREYELTIGGDVPRRRTPRIPCRRLYRARIQQPSQVRPAGVLVSIPARPTHSVSAPLDLGCLIPPVFGVGPTPDPARTRHEPYRRRPTLTRIETTPVRRKDNRPGS